MSNASRKLWKHPVVLTVMLFVALFVIGLVTRAPAWMFPQYYALHGVLAAPFCAALALWHLRRGGSVYELVAATALLALVLGMMSPAMGLGFAAVAVVTLAVWAALGRCSEGTRRFATAVVFGAVDYPCAVVVGVALGTYGPSVESLLAIVVLLILSIALAVLGASLVSGKGKTRV